MFGADGVLVCPGSGHRALGLAGNRPLRAPGIADGRWRCRHARAGRPPSLHAHSQISPRRARRRRGRRWLVVRESDTEQGRHGPSRSRIAEHVCEGRSESFAVGRADRRSATDPQLGGGSAPGTGFAIPSNLVTDIAGQIVKNGRVVDSHRASLGVSVGDTNGNGVIVGAVTAGGPCAKAGIAVGDVIVAVAGHATPTVDVLSSVLASLRVGQLPGARAGSI